MTNPSSSSTSYAIAEKFAIYNSQFNPFKPKTIFKIDTTCSNSHAKRVDVSWISPFPTEQELIFTTAGIAWIEPLPEKYSPSKPMMLIDEKYFFKSYGSAIVKWMLQVQG